MKRIIDSRQIKHKIAKVGAKNMPLHYDYLIAA